MDWDNNVLNNVLGRRSGQKVNGIMRECRQRWGRKRKAIGKE
jgi:hypothetical protein